MSKNGLLNFLGNLPAGDPAPTIEYLFINEETGEGKALSATANNIETIDKFISSRKIEFISLSIKGGNKEFEIEIDSLLAELDKNAASYLAKSWKFGYGFGSVVDLVGGCFMGHCFYINTSDYVPDDEVLDEVFSKGPVIIKIRAAIEQTFNSKTNIMGCLTG
ncbi:hypothetical protein G7045_08715 [Acidovorax sp. HDW3]|uniref:hypothetical protein n=1 Tax=Acidovorax sp. HDW3 TaxID=2714923 RepID=UPI0014093CBD|nr:hypothetical protein [Acidovorax sp. HDW3]QIL44333.1 hypothetical protein G7045_08715 [Acidovorax sp. HDW3]